MLTSIQTFQHICLFLEILQQRYCRPIGRSECSQIQRELWPEGVVLKPWQFVSQNVLMKECSMNLSHGSKIVLDRYACEPIGQSGSGISGVNHDITLQLLTSFASTEGIIRYKMHRSSHAVIPLTSMCMMGGQDSGRKVAIH
jgi:hypothetical protein